MHRPAVAFLLVLCAGLSCCTNEKDRPFESVARNVIDRTGAKVRYDKDGSAEVDAAVTELLSKPLSLDSAVQIALFNNRNLIAEFESIGIAQAEFTTAGQIQNPSFGIDARLPDKPPRGTDIEASLMFNVVDLFLLPVRKRIAANQLDQATLLAGDNALELVHQTRVAFYRLLGEQQVVDLQRQIKDTAATAQDFAVRQRAAGNINELALVKNQAQTAQAKLDFMHAETELVADREALNLLLGLNPSQLSWEAVRQLPALPDAESPPLTRRLDIQIATQQIALANQALGYSRAGVLTNVDLGVSTERETAGQTVVGPAISFEVPIFNQHQGQIARAEAELRAAKKNFDALVIKSESQVRLARAAVKAARQSAELAANFLLPNRSKAVALTQLQYNGMLTGQYELLDAKRDELSAQREGVELMRDYWIARADLDRATGN